MTCDAFVFWSGYGIGDIVFGIGFSWSSLGESMQLGLLSLVIPNSLSW
jgi:hypothetical protein